MNVRSRHHSILQALQERGEVQVSSLASEFDCSEMTIRRDLESLEARGGLRRIHGGAVSLYLSAEEAPFEIRALENTEAKAAIAAAAVDLLVEGETIILDGGTTTMAVARSMRHRRLTVMPLALRPVLELDDCQGITLLLPGGEVRSRELSLVGSLGEHAFSQLRFDTFVLGICGIDARAGVTTHMLEEADMKRAAAKSAGRVIAVADASKIGRVAFGYVCDITDVDILVTDASADESVVQELVAAGVDVRRA